MSDWRDEIETEFGREIFYSTFGKEVISSGSIIVDYLTGIGGYPLGGTVEICGSEGSGKTTLATEAVKVALKSGRSVLWLDFERTLGESFLEKMGVDVSKVKDYLLSPETMEDGWMLIKRFCEENTHRGGLIVADSVAAMPPISDVEKMKEIIGQVRVASQAQVMSHAFRQMTDVIRKAGVCVLFINQERSMIDTTGRNIGSKTTPGGAALRFYSAIRLKLEVRGSVKEDKEDALTGVKGEHVSAIEVQVTVIKNKLSPSYRRGKVYIRMDEGLDNLTSVLRLAEGLGLITKKGAYYVIDQKYSGDTLGGKTEHGFEKVRRYFLENEELRNSLVADIQAYLAAKKVT